MNKRMADCSSGLWVVAQATNPALRGDRRGGVWRLSRAASSACQLEQRRDTAFVLRTSYFVHRMPLCTVIVLLQYF